VSLDLYGQLPSVLAVKSNPPEEDANDRDEMAVGEVSRVGVDAERRIERGRLVILDPARGRGVCKPQGEGATRA
jgi:threonine dehydrogenase-like Zn-dependent dehydrogenase